MSSFIRRRIFSLAVLASVSTAALVGSSAHAAPCLLPDINEGRKFVTEAWGVPDSRFNVGEPFRIQMRVSTPSFLSLFHVSTSCKVTRLLQNFQMPPAQIVDFPSPASGLQVVVKPPAGPEAFYLVSTRNQFDFLSGADILSDGVGGIANLDLNPAQFHRRLDDALGRVNPDDWSVMTLSTTVVAH